jgi:hypothetical protein
MSEKSQMKDVVTPPSSRANEATGANAREQELRDAIERVYRKYGHDFEALRRDIHRDVEAAKQRQ